MRNNEIEKRYEGDVCDAVMRRIREENIKMRPRGFFLAEDLIARGMMVLGMFAAILLVLDIFARLFGHVHAAGF